MIDGCEVNQKYYRYIAEPTEADLLLESLCIPTQTEIRNQLGTKLADVFFENLSSEGRVFLGLGPPLKGPDELWISPDSRLKNKVRCQPIPEPQSLYQKAFAHQVILDIGQQSIDKLKQELTKEIEESLKAQSQEYQDNCEKRLTKALEEARAEADENCRQVVGTLMEHFDKCLSETVEKLKLRMRKECQLRVEDERAELASYMLVQLQEEVEKHDFELCSDFHDTLYGELNALARKYVQRISEERKIALEVVEKIVRKYETMLVDLRAEMEFCSIVDVCRAIKEEKMKHELEVKNSEAGSKTQSKAFAMLIADLKNKNKTLQKMAKERSERIKQYQKKMKILVEEFQKFVNYALKAAPGHAEFLLSAQQMIMKKYHEDTLLDPEDYKRFQECVQQNFKDVHTTIEMPVKEREVACVEVKKKKERKDPLAKCKAEKSSKYTFNYYKFKYILLKNLIKGIHFDHEPTAEKKKSVKKEAIKSEEENEEEEEEEEFGEQSQDELEEYKQGLVLAGETATDHMKPIQTFLSSRMQVLIELCKDDPDMAKMMIGCPLKSESEVEGTKQKYCC